MWYERFKDGWEEVLEKVKSGHLSTSRDEDNCRVVASIPTVV